jgi:hypothetical protein
MPFWNIPQYLHGIYFRRSAVREIENRAALMTTRVPIQPADEETSLAGSLLRFAH